MTWQPAGDYEDIRYELSTGEDAGIAKITINRPEVRNAYLERRKPDFSRFPRRA